MDSVRFGRALGIGARAAAKTLVTAVDAATSQPSSPRPAARPPLPAPPRPSRIVQQAARTATQVRTTGKGIAQGNRPLASCVGAIRETLGVLWLEFTGVFFRIFWVFCIPGGRRLHTAIRETLASNHEAHVHFLLAAGMSLLFGYFCITSFLRASHRQRRR